MTAMDWERLDLSLDEIIKKNDGGGRRLGRPRPETKPRSIPSSGRKPDPKVKGPSKAAVTKRARDTKGRPVVGRPAVAPRILPTTKFVVKNNLIRSATTAKTTTSTRKEEVFVTSSSDRKARIHPDRGLITLRNDSPAPVKVKEIRSESRSRTRTRSLSRTRTRSLSRDNRVPEKRSERLEIRITNEKAVQPQPSMSSESMVPAPMVSPNLSIPSIPNSGLLSSSSHFRTPMAVMDLYTSRYARPTLEPYRPPPAIQQFYRSLAESTALGHIPAHYNPMVQNQAAFQQQQLQQHQQQQQQHQSSHSNMIRKPFDN